MGELTREQVEEGDFDRGQVINLTSMIDEQQAQEIERLEGCCKERLKQGQQLRDQLAAMTAERDTWKALCETAQDHRATVAAHRDELESKLATAQARVTKLEKALADERGT